MKSKKVGKTMAKSSSKVKKLPKSSSNFSKKWMLICAVIFGVIGVVTLLTSLAATKTVKYFGELTAAKPSVTYKLTMGEGKMHVDFSNNTADVVLTITNTKSGAIVGSIKSRGRTDIGLDANVTPGTYAFKLTTRAAFTSVKGYKILIAYPEEAPVNPVDTTPPTTILSAPLAQTEVSGATNLSAIATDVSGVSKVDFYVNNVLKGTDTISPYSVSWDTTKTTNGTVTVSAKAYDGKGNMGEASGVVNVKNVTVGVTRRFPGDSNPRVTGKAYFGSSVGGNGDPAKHETPTGKSLSVRRTFFQWDAAINTTINMYNIIADDHANNRLPFVSFKPPRWADVGSGKHDADLDKMLKKLDSFGKPVWLTAHHEPEGGGGSGNSPDDAGGPTAWRAMQTRIRTRMTAVGTKNVAFMPILMCYTWDKNSGRNPDEWWVSGIWDAYICDHYRDNVSGDLFTSGSWNNFAAWSEARSMPYGTGEWGNRGTDATSAAENNAFWEWGFKNKKDVIAHTYFDSSLNSPNGSWELVGPNLTWFHSILKSDPRVQRINDL